MNPETPTNPTHIVGIDLGTTNCAVAGIELRRGEYAPVEDFPVPQLLRPGEVAARPLFPSCLYIPGEHELPPGSTTLPWEEKSKLVTGEFARWQGGRVPGRLVASAKSWLCHAGVDRTAAILPWVSTPDTAKISPVEASALLLAHIAAAWDSAHPEAPLARQETVLTVPASFDEMARSLTVSAARQAGLENFTLLEEPQAAFYNFTAQHRRDLAAALEGVRLALVVDVGGGTTDFSLIQAGVSPAGPILKRLAVGDHLMLGGDNMDSALARHIEERWASAGRKLSATQWTQLVQAARAAKETLLGRDGPERQSLAIAAEGSRLLGGTLSAEIAREEIASLVLDGFFPACGIGDEPRKTTRSALRELGLPYAQDPAVTRHLAAFLRQHAASGLGALQTEASPGALPRPDAILLNGGVFNSPVIADRLMEVVSSWWPEAPRIRLLPHDSLDLAVARGAAYYGLARRGLGKRIGGGAARAFYIGLADAGESASPRAVCVIPRGHEEGDPVDLNTRPFTLTLGRPVQFPLFSTTSDRIDLPGDVVQIGEEFRALPPIHTLLKGSFGRATTVPVHLRAIMTELGTLELWCVSDADEARWRLEFALRDAPHKPSATVTEAMPARFEEARALVDRVYGALSPGTDPKEAKQLGRALESIIGPRESWRLPLLRELWGALQAGAKRRRRTVEHERVFLQLTGYCLRPGFGYPLDDWRCEQTFQRFTEGVFHPAAPAVWNEYWILWRRVAAGLSEAAQNSFWEQVKPRIARMVSPETAKTMAKNQGARPLGVEEMLRAAASMELIDPAEKVVFGNWMAELGKKPGAGSNPWAWCLGRLGAREPVRGSVHKTVGPDQASAWLGFLLETGVQSVDGGAFAAAQLARLTGDRARDIDEGLSERVVAALREAQAPEAWLRMVSEVTALEAADEARALGDTLPIGLKIR